MWQQYRKTFVLTQLFIAAACGSLLYFAGRDALPLAGAVFVIMQLGAFVGAAFGARVKARMERAKDVLPLQRRR